MFRFSFASEAGAVGGTRTDDYNQFRRLLLLRPELLLGDKALHQLRPFFLIRLNTLMEEHFANLRDVSLLVTRYSLNVALEFGIDPKRQKLALRHNCKYICSSRG